MTPKEELLEFIDGIISGGLDDEYINKKALKLIDKFGEETKKEMIEKIESKGDDIIRVKDLLEELESEGK